MTATVSPAASSSVRASRPRALRTTLLLLAAVVVAVALDAVVAAIALASGGLAGYGPLSFPAYASMTVLGVGAGWVGWVLVRRYAKNPRRTLAVLVPVVLIVSFVPDVALLVLRFIPGTTVAVAVALMVMHIVVAAVAVPAYVLASRR